MEVIPITLKKANEFVTVYHTHNKKVVGCKFCIGVNVNNVLEAVAIVGRPVARKLDDSFTVEILRLCTKQKGIKNLCSLLYSRSWKIWKLMGGKRIITYTLESENVSFGKNETEYNTILNVYGEVFANALQLCEITNTGIYKLDVNKEAFTISSENGIEKVESRPAAVFQKFEDATVEFTAPLHKLFEKDETVKICFNDNSPIFIIGENAKIVRAPYIDA